MTYGGVGGRMRPTEVQLVRWLDLVRGLDAVLEPVKRPGEWSTGYGAITVRTGVGTRPCSSSAVPGYTLRVPIIY